MLDLFGLHQEFRCEGWKLLPVAHWVFIDLVGLLVQVLVVLLDFYFTHPQVLVLALDLPEEAHVFGPRAEREFIQTLLEEVCLFLPKVDPRVSEHQEQLLDVLHTRFLLLVFLLLIIPVLLTLFELEQLGYFVQSGFLVFIWCFTEVFDSRVVGVLTVQLHKMTLLFKDRFRIFRTLQH